VPQADAVATSGLICFPLSIWPVCLRGWAMRDLIQVGQILDELVRRANADPHDYRPWGDRFYRQRSAARNQRKGQFTKPAKNFLPLQGEQLSLFPCADLFPEAYL